MRDAVTYYETYESFADGKVFGKPFNPGARPRQFAAAPNEEGGAWKTI